MSPQCDVSRPIMPTRTGPAAFGFSWPASRNRGQNHGWRRSEPVCGDAVPPSKPFTLKTTTFLS